MKASSSIFQARNLEKDWKPRSSSAENPNLRSWESNLRDDRFGLRVAEEVELLIPTNPDVEVGLDYWGGLRLMERMVGFN